MTITATTAPTPITAAQPAAAAEALVALLPSTSPLTATLIGADGQRAGAWAGDTGTAVVASFVGASSADVAIVLDGAEAVAADAGIDATLVSIVDVLRPALEGATAVLGAGVLGEARTDDAAVLFADDETSVFELVRSGAHAGWFGIRIRQSLAETGSGRARSVVDRLGRLNSVEMALTVEIGRTRMSVRDLLSLEPGTIVELDRSAGSPADVLLNGRLIARGEIVVVDQDYAVRITSILDVAEGLA